MTFPNLFSELFYVPALKYKHLNFGFLGGGHDEKLQNDPLRFFIDVFWIAKVAA